MLKLNQKGQFNPLVIPLILSVIFMIAFGVVGLMYYSKFVEQRDNNQPQIEAAVKEAEADQKKQLEAEFVEREKQPNVTYIGPAEFGSVRLTYPKTWSSYVKLSSGREVDFYGHPNYVPADKVNYALRMSVTSNEFAQEIKQYDGKVKQGDLKARSVEVSGTKGVRVDGFLTKDQEVSMVVFPLRDKTLRVWTENKDFRKDFDNIIVKKLTFVP